MKIVKLSLFCASLFSIATLLANDPTPQAPLYPNPPGNCPSFFMGGDASIAIDYFRSLPDGSWTGNGGAFGSVNLAFGIPKEKYGFGAQVGGSYGLYDWDARGSNTSGNTKALQQQGYLTFGFFRQTPSSSGVNAGVVYDVQFNKEFGVFSLNPIIAQVRGQLGYVIVGRNEVGAWASYDTQTSHKESQELPVTFRPISQANIFWAHYFKNTAQTMLWAGTPYRRGLMNASGRAGRYILGANFRAPLSKAFSIVGHAAYMAANSGPATQESKNYAANICFGLNYAFGGCKAGQRPYMALADNSNFLVDSNVNF